MPQIVILTTFISLLQVLVETAQTCMGHTLYSLLQQVIVPFETKTCSYRSDLAKYKISTQKFESAFAYYKTLELNF